jgi:hypothetical protein
MLQQIPLFMHACTRELDILPATQLSEFSEQHGTQCGRCNAQSRATCDLQLTICSPHCHFHVRGCQACVGHQVLTLSDQLQQVCYVVCLLPNLIGGMYLLLLGPGTACEDVVVMVHPCGGGGILSANMLWIL